MVQKLQMMKKNKINIFNLIKLAKKNKPLKLGIVNVWRPTIITKKGEKNGSTRSNTHW